MMRTVAFTIQVLAWTVMISEILGAPSQHHPRLTKTDSSVLFIECKIPYYLAWEENWDYYSVIDLELTYQKSREVPQHVPERVAILKYNENKPVKIDRFATNQLVEANAIKIPKFDSELTDDCENCRSLLVKMPGRIGQNGQYVCNMSYKHKTQSKIHYMSYTALLDETFIQESGKTLQNGSLTVRNVLAHKIRVVWMNDTTDQRTQTISIRRTTVDSRGCPLGENGTSVELFHKTDYCSARLFKSHGSLLFDLNSSGKESTLTLFVRTCLLCYADYRYACDISGVHSDPYIPPDICNAQPSADSSSHGWLAGCVICIVVILLSGFILLIVFRKKIRRKFIREEHCCCLLSCGGRKGEGENGAGGNGAGGNGAVGSGRGEGRSGEGENGEGRSGEGENGESRSGEGRSGEGRSGEGGSGEGRIGEGRSGEDSSGEGRSGERENGEGRSCEGRSGKGENGEGRSGEGRRGRSRRGGGRRDGGGSGQRGWGGGRRDGGGLGSSVGWRDGGGKAVNSDSHAFTNFDVDSEAEKKLALLVPASESASESDSFL